MMKLPNRAELTRFIKFGITGGLNTVIDFAVYTLLVYAFPIDLYAAQTVGYACGTINSYIINRSWTFGSKNRFFSMELLRFLVVNLITLGISFVAMYFLQLWFPGIHKLVLKLPVVAVTIVVNFVLSRLWVFRPQEKN